jgi:hypothetical protein
VIVVPPNRVSSLVRLETKANARPKPRSSGLNRGYRILGLPRDASRSAVEKAFKRLARSCHEDTGGSHEKMKELIAARDLLRKKLRSRGRPRKYPLVVGYKIVDQNGKTYWEGFKTRREAKDFLKARQAASIANPDATPDQAKKTFRVIGNAVAERQRAKRLRDKKRKREEALEIQRYIYNPNAGMSAGKYMTDAPHGKGLLVCGGNDSKHISEIDAAHRASEGGLGDDAPPVRRSRPRGNGPDVFAREDSTADQLDNTERFSKADPDCEHELWERDDTGRLFIESESGVRDQLAGPSVEDREFPEYEGWDELPIDDSSYILAVDEDGEPCEYVAPRADKLLGGKVADEEEREDNGLPQPLAEIVAETDPNPEPEPINSAPAFPEKSAQPILEPSEPEKRHENTPKTDVVLVPNLLST